MGSQNICDFCCFCSEQIGNLGTVLAARKPHLCQSFAHQNMTRAPCCISTDPAILRSAHNRQSQYPVGSRLSAVTHHSKGLWRSPPQAAERPAALTRNRLPQPPRATTSHIGQVGRKQRSGHDRGPDWPRHEGDGRGQAFSIFDRQVLRSAGRAIHKTLLYLYFLFRIVCPHCVKNELGLHLCRGASTHGATCKVVDYEADVYNMSGSSASACLSAPKKLIASCPCGVSMKVPMYWKSE